MKSRGRKKGYWDNKDNQREFLDTLGNKLAFKSWDDWYKITGKLILLGGGGDLLNKKYHGSPSKLVLETYGCHPWNESRFNTKQGHWNAHDLQKQFLERLGNQLHFQRMEDWYSVTYKQLLANGAASLLHKYGDSPSKMIASIYTEHQWDLSRFNSSMSGKGGQKTFLDQLGKQLHFQQMEDWYTITSKQVVENGGRGILVRHGNSLSHLVMSVYSDHQWKQENFNSRYQLKHWDDKSNRVALVKQLTKKLHIKDLEEWYRISLSQIGEVHKHMRVFQRYPLEELLSETYPNHLWNKAALKYRSSSIRASQRWLRISIQKLFPQSDIYENFHHPELKHREAGTLMELDIFLPKEMLAFEYQGEHHYRDMYYMGYRWQHQNQKDSEKKDSCLEIGITLIDIPYWWNKQTPTLAATVHHHRPDLLLEYYKIDLIPQRLPERGDREGEAMPLMHGEDWSGDEDLNGWISEKLDGVRIFWNGQKVLSRVGKEIWCPEWYLEGLPSDCALDGELWIGWGTLELLNATLSSRALNSSWRAISMMVFDLPNSKEPYEVRLRDMAKLQLPSHVQVVDVVKCRGRAHLQHCLVKVLESGGEGLIVRRPNSFYVAERTDALLKVKPCGDCEVQVLELLPSGLYCIQSNGLKCTIGCNEQLHQAPKIGSLITVKHSGYYKNGVLRHPLYWRTYEGAEPYLYLQESSYFLHSNWFGSRVMASKADWQYEANHREFFDQLGMQMNYKNLDEYGAIHLDLVKKYGGQALMEYFYGESPLQALQQVYPDHIWDA